MVALTTPQTELLLWIGRSVGSLRSSRSQGAHLVTIRGETRPADPADINELEALGLIRKTGRDVYEITDAGRVVCREIATPPHAAGFREDPPAR